MYLVEKELRTQFAAIGQTVDAMMAAQDAVKAQFADVKALCVLGCGSSYSLAKSAAMLYSQHTGNPACALPAGDVLVNFDAYKNMLAGHAVLVLSRSGSTSEAVRAVALCKEALGCKVFSICMKEHSALEQASDWSICLPWAFDEAVCQTRTVTNLYVACLALACILAGDKAQLSRLAELAPLGETFQKEQESSLSALAGRSWTKAVVLADNAVAGLAEEGALAFKEICRRDSNHYHVLDVRHGPMVQIGSDTLVIAMLSSGDMPLQQALVNELAAKTPHLLVLHNGGFSGTDGMTCMQLPDLGSDESSAVFGIYCIQLLCFLHALVRGVDPDQPEGLDAWIKL